MATKPRELARIQIRIERFNEQGQQIADYIRTQAKKAREEKGLSQRELSFKVNRSKGFISKMESGDVVPSVTDLLAMAIILEKPLKYFVPAFAYFAGPEDKTNGREWELLSNFREIGSEELQELAIKQVRQLAEIKPKGSK